MDIHKPKPVHSFREFLSEIAVVVVGIAIALSGEQLIEHLHDRHKAMEARDGIREEIIHNLTVLQRRAVTQQCVDRRLEGIAELLGTSPESGYSAPTWLSRPQIWEMVHARWQASVQSGRTPLLTSDEQVVYGFLYELFADIMADEDHEQLAWAQLRALEGLGNPTAELRDKLRVPLQEARYLNFDIAQLTVDVGTGAAKLGISKQAAPPQGETWNDGGICFPMTTSRSDALQRLSAIAHGTIAAP